jgi:hypothetical protein
MRYSNRLLLFVLVAIAISAYASPKAVAQTKGTLTLNQPVARVLKENISSRQIKIGNQERNDAKRQYKGAEYEKWLREYEADKLVSLILNPLLREYARAHGITASVDEINSVSRAVFGKRIARGAIRTIAEATVIQWKVSKSLYQQYGGTVIFQQSNPLEPVGAYQKFLEEQEQKKAFEIFNPQLRTAFWCYFTCEQSMIVPPEEVNYDIPWWLQKAKP